MPENTNSILAYQLFKQIQVETGQVSSLSNPPFVMQSEIMSSLNEMPEDAVLLGIANDGLPLLLRLRDPRPGAVLITGDRGSGKTDFLKMMIKTSKRFCLAQGTRYLVISDTPDQYLDIEPFGHSLEVWPAYQDTAAEILREIAWRLDYQDFFQPIVLMIDGFEAILKMDQRAQDSLREILLKGPQSLIWPIVTVNSNMAARLPEWLAFFRTRIYGRIIRDETREALTPIPGAPLQLLRPHAQFCLRQKSNWLTFWLPSLED